MMPVTIQNFAIVNYTALKSLNQALECCYTFFEKNPNSAPKRIMFH